MADIHDEASKVDAENGEVVMTGPGGVAISLTPEAALETSDRLHEAGVIAVGQRAEKISSPNASRY